MRSRIRCASAVSQHPLPSHAVGECVGRLLDAAGDGPDVLILNATSALTGALEDVVGAVQALLSPALLVGASSDGLLAGSNHVDSTGALSLFGIWGLTGRARPVRLAPRDTFHALSGPWLDSPGSEQIADLRPEPDVVAEPDLLTLFESTTTGTLLVWTAAANLPAGDAGELLGEPDERNSDRRFAAELNRIAPELAVVGGTGPVGPRHSAPRLVLGDSQYVHGSVGVLFASDAPVRTAVSQGYRPIGPPMTVTATENGIVREIAGRPALEVVRESVAALEPRDIHLASEGLYLGRVVDDSLTSPSPQDHLVRPILGGDTRSGAIAVGDDVELGATVQLQLTDESAALADLADTIGGVVGDIDPAGSYAFISDGRASASFAGGADDRSLLSELLGPAALGGVSCSAQFAPIGGQNFAHSNAVAVAVFG